ncbi:hypothetical protein DFS33DRAFT_1413965 [Desarmillaria ectypa]|nr:hypothetical protein DFS33DRAFT_1413965 [Desarmillaria ectypa]
MSERTAKTYTHVSNRAKPQKEKEKERKVVLKSVLDNPFRIRWPSVPVNLQNLILAQVLLLVEGVSVHRPRAKHELSAATPKRKREMQEEEGSEKKQKTTQSADAFTPPANGHSIELTNGDSGDPPAISDHANIPPLSPISKHLVVGINAVTKRLECQIQAARHTVVISSPCSTEKSSEPSQSLKYIFVCRSDVDPPILIDHIPHLVASFNNCKPSEPIKLIPLPKGAEVTLAECLNIRRIAVFAFDNEAACLSTLSTISENVPVIAAPWLVPQPNTSDRQIVPTYIKQVRTSAPRDMKAAKEKRAADRAAAKQKRRRNGGRDGK